MKEEKQIELEKYKLFMQSAEENSNKRINQNNIHLTINLAFLSYIVTSEMDLVASVILLISGLINCLLWFNTIDNYSKRNKVKFDIINESEYGSLYKEEWKRISLLTSLTFYEKAGAILFTVLYIAVFAFRVF